MSTSGLATSSVGVANACGICKAAAALSLLSLLLFATPITSTSLGMARSAGMCAMAPQDRPGSNPMMPTR